MLTPTMLSPSLWKLHSVYSHKQAVNPTSPNKQSHPLHRTHFDQHQPTLAVLGERLKCILVLDIVQEQINDPNMHPILIKITPQDVN